ncbi:MAG: MinD/ParA family protein [Haloarculaceae archaeon]
MGGAVYAVIGGKGGVGKTTTAVNLGVVLGRTGRDAVVVDADLAMTNVAARLGLDAEPGLHRVLAEEAPVRDAVVTGPGGLAVLPGDRELGAYGEADPERLPRVLDLLAVAYDVVLVDTGPGVQHEGLVAMGAADGAVVVATADEVAIHDANRTIAVADRVDCPVVGGVLTRADGRSTPTVADALDPELLGVIPEYDVPAGGPTAAVAPDSDAAAAYRSMAESLPLADAATEGDAAGDEGAEAAASAQDADEDADRGANAGERAADGDRVTT